MVISKNSKQQPWAQWERITRRIITDSGIPMPSNEWLRGRWHADQSPLDAKESAAREFRLRPNAGGKPT